MGELGKLLPHASTLDDRGGDSEVDNLQEWRVPITVFDDSTGEPYKVVRVYEEEGILCIDIEIPKEEA